MRRKSVMHMVSPSPSGGRTRSERRVYVWPLTMERRRFVTLRIFRPSPAARYIADEKSDTAHRPEQRVVLRPAPGSRDIVRRLAARKRTEPFRTGSAGRW